MRATIPFVDRDRGLHAEIEQLAERIVAGDVTATAERRLAEALA